MKKTKAAVATGSIEDFLNRIRGHAANLDRGETVAPKITIIFEDPLEMLNVLTAERIRLLKKMKDGALPVSILASGLRRDIRAVSRDVTCLERAGLLRTSYRANPGHGRYKVVEPVAREYNLSASI